MDAGIGHIGFILNHNFRNNMPELVKRALEHLHRAQFQQAIQQFEQALQTPNKIKTMTSFDCQLHLSTAYLQLGRYQQCRQICTDLITQSPHQEQPYINLSVCLTHLKQYEKSLELCNRMLMLNNRNWRFYLVRGYTQSHMGNYEEASNSYGIAIAKNAYNNPRTYMLQAGCLAAMDQNADAIKNMHYAQTAMKQDQDKNCLTLYRYEINNVRAGLKIYEKYTKKIVKAQNQKLLKTDERTGLQTQLIKIVSKSVEYCMAKSQKIIKQRSMQKQSHNDNINDIENCSQSQEGQRNFNEDIQIFQNNMQLKTKVSITTESSSQKIDSNSGLACEWIRSKCAIF